MTASHLLVFYDGHCALCQFWVQFLIRRDRHDRFRFAALQSPLAQRNGIAPTEDMTPDSVIVMKDQLMLTDSTAALTLLATLGGLWSFFRIFLLLPCALRDPVYRLIARYRYRWFGRTDTCYLPRPEWKHKFIEE
ncbi:MAG: DCC1-like thiol-disulfide oxidoreductase family protein [Saprospiraceae bacterium]|nr:DCC1-like thiol-disulfide oxidoreductase family protein [Saprospiraceae bacterium]